MPSDLHFVSPDEQVLSKRHTGAVVVAVGVGEAVAVGVGVGEAVAVAEATHFVFVESSTMLTKEQNSVSAKQTFDDVLWSKYFTPYAQAVGVAVEVGM